MWRSMVATPPARLAVLISIRQLSLRFMLNAVTGLCKRTRVWRRWRTNLEFVTTSSGASVRSCFSRPLLGRNSRAQSGSSRTSAWRAAMRSSCACAQPNIFFRFDDALESVDGLRSVDAAQRFDRFDTEVRSCAHGQIAVGDGEQTPKSLAVGCDAECVDEQGHDQGIYVVKQRQQNAATRRRGAGAGADLPDDAVLGRACKILHPAGENHFSGLRVPLAEQADHVHCFSDGRAAHRAAQVLEAFFTKVAG